MDRITAANVYVAIVERGSLTAAAESLDMSRSMVTRYLAEIEDWAGARLLHRSTRRLSLTPAGEQVQKYCRQLLSIAEQLSNSFDIEEAPLQGRLRISCPPSLGQDILIPVFKTYLERYPGVDIDLHVSNQAVNLIEERIDLAIRITNELDPNLIARKLGECASVVCTAPDYLDRVGTPSQLEDLTELNCMTYSRFGKSLWLFDHQEGVSSIPVSGNLTANDPSALLQAALDGIGISMQPEYSVLAHIEAGRLVRLLPDYQPQVLGIYGLYSSRQHMSKALRAMIDMLVESLA
ncbi:LysR family transcriptional regulator [Amphritea balenae]|uniref:LysR family transcriptional regulator n=2 Tax=Amphritea balenae TaxID=452629 RepID=A0A3P1SX70_9GAMM|nr:LysR family transcriptional regulator [Amphritea balenae]